LDISMLLTAIAPAKLNLALHITGKRPDGYHTIETLVAFADQGDVLTIAPAAEITLEVIGPFAGECGAPEENLVLRVAHELRARLGIAMGAHMVLEKHLPVGAGLGGGSSDAATAIRLLLKLWGQIRGVGELSQWFLPLGADLPMCLAGTPLMARGIGEELELCHAFPELFGVLCWPGVSVPTAKVYAQYVQERELPPIEPDTSSPVGLLASLAPTRNMLQRAAVAVAPEVAEALLVLETLPQKSFVRMTGSGACCVAYTPDAQEAAHIAETISERYPEWWVRLMTVKAKQT
jgi:4-diphosphocytidyl-2-C-methyl-D-erythritol kinase